jgi:hypothetical protein
MERTQRGLTALMIGLMACAFVVATTAWASAPESYVLNHPKPEHCKAHYVKRVVTGKKRIHGTTKKVRETVCVHIPKPKVSVPPAQESMSPVPTPPTPVPIPAPVPTPPPAVATPAPVATPPRAEPKASATVGSLGTPTTR